MSAPSENTRKTESSTNFSKQVSIDDPVYQIRDQKPADQNVADQPPANSPQRNAANEGVLPIPQGSDSQNSPSSKLPTKGSSLASLDRALPLKKSPTVTPESIRNNINKLPFPYDRLPEGVVNVKKSEKNNLEEIGDSFPNRYRSNLMENERVNEEEAKKSEQAAARVEEAERDNGAHEELDFAAPEEEKVRLEPNHNNNMGLADNLRDAVQERAAEADQNEQLEEEDGRFNVESIEVKVKH